MESELHQSAVLENAEVNYSRYNKQVNKIAEGGHLKEFAMHTIESEMARLAQLRDEARDLTETYVTVGNILAN